MPEPAPFDEGPTSAEFGAGVTVCIAARSAVHNCIVAASDMMLSFPDDSIAATDDVAIKSLKIGRHWCALYAGDPSCALSIVTRADDEIRKGADESIRTVQGVVKESYREELQQQITDRFLSRYNLTIDQFRKTGRRQFGDEEFAKLNAPIREFSLKTSFLVCGTGDMFPHIVSINSPGGHIVNHDQLGYWAIGTGARIALSALAGRPLGGLPLSDLIYRVAEAKFAAETAHGVGPRTLITLLRNRVNKTIYSPHTEQLKDVWKRKRREPAPAKAVEIIKDGFGSLALDPNS